MKYITKRIKIHFLLTVSAMMILTSCNKDLEQFRAAPVVQGTAPTVASLLDAADLTIFKAAVTRAGAMTQLTVPTNRFTVFAPTDAAMTSAGLSLAVVNAIPLTSLVPLVQYHIVPQTLLTSSIPNTFPNFGYPTTFNPAPPLSALLRLDVYPSTRNGNWINNVPMISLNNTAVNGAMHKIAAVNAPPQRYLWDRINTDTDLTLFKAVIQRADQVSTPATNLSSPTGILNNIGANLTVFAPSNQSVRNLVSGLTGGAIPAVNYVSAPGATSVGTTVVVTSTTGLIPGMSVTVTSGTGAFAANTFVATVVNATSFTVSATPTIPLVGAVVTGNPDPVIMGFIAGSLPAANAQGIAFYHIMGVRAFTNNFPTTATSYPTLLNGAVPTHPGVSLVCTFTGPGVSAASVKGAANATASNIALNPTPDPGGTSDQNFLNGSLHKINQVLLPQ